MSGLEPYVPPEDRPTWVCEHACMLFAGLVGHGPGHPIVNRLIELGALPSRVDAPPRWNIADPSIVILSQNGESRERSWPGLHCEIATDPLPMADAVVDHAAGQVDELWADRLVPFEANLRTNRRAPRRQHAVLAGPDPTWPGQARRLIARLRFRVDGQVIRIDHIGSTSVPGLPAKQLIDIQVVVADLAAAARVAEAGRHSGAVHVSGRWFGTDRHGTDHPEEVLVDADPERPVNINIRPVGAPVWRETLLLRDWLRSHDDERDAYAGMKRGLAQRPGHDVDEVASVGTALNLLLGRSQGIDRRVSPGYAAGGWPG
jgi:GrpB-like predicted nucleotidyltransferase (UPF0157 family)